jgi:hypothetical protein
MASPSELYNGMLGLGSRGWGWMSQPENALGALALLGTGLGTYGQYSQAADQERRARQMYDLARQPVDWRQFYQPMSDLASQAYSRQLRNEMLSYGAPPQGAYLSNAVAEGMAKDESARVARAMELANQYRNSQLYGYGQRGGANPFAGATGAFGDYLKWRAMAAARERGNQTAGATAPGAQAIGTPTGPGMFAGWGADAQGGNETLSMSPQGTWAAATDAMYGGPAFGGGFFPGSGLGRAAPPRNESVAQAPPTGLYPLDQGPFF